MLVKFHRPNTARNVRASYFPHYVIQRILEGAIRIRPNHLVRISRRGGGGGMMIASYLNKLMQKRNRNERVMAINLVFRGQF